MTGSSSTPKFRYPAEVPRNQPPSYMNIYKDGCFIIPVPKLDFPYFHSVHYRAPVFEVEFLRALEQLTPEYLWVYRHGAERMFDKLQQRPAEATSYMDNVVKMQLHRIERQIIKMFKSHSNTPYASCDTLKSIKQYFITHKATSENWEYFVFLAEHYVKASREQYRLESFENLLEIEFFKELMKGRFNSCDIVEAFELGLNAKKYALPIAEWSDSAKEKILRYLRHELWDMDAGKYHKAEAEFSSDGGNGGDGYINKSKMQCSNCKKRGHYKIQCTEERKAKRVKISPENSDASDVASSCSAPGSPSRSPPAFPSRAVSQSSSATMTAEFMPVPTQFPWITSVSYHAVTSLDFFQTFSEKPANIPRKNIIPNGSRGSGSVLVQVGQKKRPILLTDVHYCPSYDRHFISATAISEDLPIDTDCGRLLSRKDKEVVGGHNGIPSYTLGLTVLQPTEGKFEVPEEPEEPETSGAAKTIHPQHIFGVRLAT